MKQYLELLKDVLENGTDKSDRTGVGSRAVFGRQLRFDLSEGFPILTTRKVSLRIAFEETMFFLRGDTDSNKLAEKNINIWKGNTSREFLDKVGLNNLPEGNMGKGYGHLQRNFNGEIDLNTGKGIGGIDQIKILLDGIKADPYGRRHIVTHWNPAQLHEAALPPCHLMHMYSVVDGKLNSCFIMRSADIPFGLPYNTMGYALLNHIFAKHLGLIPGELVYMGWDAHIYQNQFEMAQELLQREPKPLPQLIINKDLNTLEDIMSLEFSDLELSGYDPHPDIKNKPGMVV